MGRKCVKKFGKRQRDHGEIGPTTFRGKPTSDYPEC